jgi:hypothetical protein
MGRSKVVYRPREGATAESELGAVVAAYRYLIFGCHGSDKGTGTGAPDGARIPHQSQESVHDDRR